MATHSSILAWTEEPSGLQSMGFQKRHNRSNLHPIHFLTTLLFVNVWLLILKKGERVLLSDRPLSYLTQLVNLCQ